MASPLLGWISPSLRTVAQQKAHLDALSKMPMFAIPDWKDPGKVKVVLTDYWKAPEVVSDIGQEFTGFHQLTGSCVGASAGNAVATLGFIQRKIASNPTKAFVPWWLFPYGRTRANEGDVGQGEGAVDSVMGSTLESEGVFDINVAGLPKFSTDDGWYLDTNTEYEWSDGNASVVKKFAPEAKPHPVTHAVINSVEDVRKAIINGYPVLYGCTRFVNSGSIQDSGANAVVVGRYDSSGGHSTCWLGVWDHPDLGPLYLYSNQWPTSTYPKDPAGGGRCTCWIKESEVNAALTQYGAGDGEAFALSHVNYFPAQPAILDWSF